MLIKLIEAVIQAGVWNVLWLTPRKDEEFSQVAEWLHQPRISWDNRYGSNPL